jgi:hypothetical protein
MSRFVLIVGLIASVNSAPAISQSSAGGYASAGTGVGAFPFAPFPNFFDQQNQVNGYINSVQQSIGSRFGGAADPVGFGSGGFTGAGGFAGSSVGTGGFATPFGTSGFTSVGNFAPGQPGTVQVTRFGDGGTVTTHQSGPGYNGVSSFSGTSGFGTPGNVHVTRFGTGGTTYTSGAGGVVSQTSNLTPGGGTVQVTRFGDGGTVTHESGPGFSGVSSHSSHSSGFPGGNVHVTRFGDSGIGTGGVVSSGGPGYSGVSSSSTSSNVNGVVNRHAVTSVNNNGHVKTYSAHN